MQHKQTLYPSPWQPGRPDGKLLLQRRAILLVKVNFAYSEVPGCWQQHSSYQALCGPWSTHHPLWIVCMWSSGHFCVQNPSFRQRWDFAEVASTGCLGLIGCLAHKSQALLMARAFSPLKILFLPCDGTSTLGSLLLETYIHWQNNVVGFMLQRSTGLSKGLV